MNEEIETRQIGTSRTPEVNILNVRVQLCQQNSSFLYREGTMKETFEKYLAFGSLAMQAGTILSYCYGVLNDPLYLLVTLLIGFMLSLWFCVSAFTPTTLKSTFVDDKTGIPFEIRRPKPMTVRITASAVQIVSTVALLIGLIADWKRAFDLADIGEPVFPALPLAGANEKDRVPYSVAMTGKELDFRDIGQLAFAGEGIDFVLAKRPRIGWLQIKDLRVKVESYESIPKEFSLQASAPTPRNETNFFLCKIDQPQEPVHSIFHAKRIDITALMDGKVRPNYNAVLLTDESPQAFAIRIIAKKPGIYTYAIEIDVGYRWKTQTFTVCPSRKCAFIQYSTSAI